MCCRCVIKVAIVGVNIRPRLHTVSSYRGHVEALAVCSVADGQVIVRLIAR